MELIHQDRTGELAAPLSARIYEGRVARIHPDGDPLRYSWGDEFRDVDGLQEILRELNSPKPFTLLHPSELLSRGAPGDVVGQVIGARVDGNFVVARILVTDDRAVAAITGGMHELSLGYTSRLDEHRRQRDIKIDHLALVPKARCGAMCALRADDDSATCPCASHMTNGSQHCTCNNVAISYNTHNVGDSPNTDTTLSTAQRHELPAHMFAAPESKSLPIEDEGHVRAAMSRFTQTTFKGPSERKAAYHHIVARAHQLGIDPSGFKRLGAQVDGEEGHLVMEELQKKLGEALAASATEKARADQLDVELKVAKAALTAAEIASTNAQAALGTEKKLAEEANTRADQAKVAAEVAVIQAKADAASSMNAAVAARVQLLTEANQILGVKDSKGQLVDRSSLDDQAIRLAVIKHVDGLEFPADKDPLFVQGVYAGSLARAASATASRAAVREATIQVRAEAARAVTVPGANAARAAESAAQKAMVDDQAKRWRSKAN